jgi:hypothetical protein
MLRGVIRLASWSRKIWSIFGICLLLLAVVNFGLEKWLDSRPLLPADWYGDAIDPSEAPWLNEFSREFEETAFRPLRNRWQPYVYGRNAPFDGKLINIDERGIRRTTNTMADSASPDHPRIVMLGGSTLWGHGARDEHTIPSCLARLLGERGRQVEIVNLGQLGYVNTQEVFTLWSELQRNRAPQMVIFVDGFNDILSTLVNQTTGWSINEVSRQREFKSSRQPASELFGMALRRTAISRTFIPELSYNTDAFGPGPAAEAPKGDAGQAIVDLYLENLRMVMALGRDHDFATLAYWQPIPFEKHQLSKSEQAHLVGQEQLRQPCLHTYQRFREAVNHLPAWLAAGPGGAYCLGDLFDAPQWAGRTSFYDQCHLTEAANLFVAERLLPDVERLLDQGQRTVPGDK